MAVNSNSAMTLNALVFFLYTLGICQEGLTALIQTKQAVMAAAGEQVCLNCQLTVPKDVHQVTWQKVLPDGERNVATFSKYTGQRVNPGFQGKVEFKDAGLQNSSIVIMGVTDQDEGCYRCLFNTYPEGALMSSTCLKLYELHGPFLHIMESNISDEAVVSCSATARPAPTVTMRVPNLQFRSFNNSYSNKNGTVTFNATAVLQRILNSHIKVECEVQVPFVDSKKVFEMIPEKVWQALTSGHEEETGSSLQVFPWIMLPMVLMVLLGVWGLVKLLCQYREAAAGPEEPKTPLRPAEVQIITPLLQHQDEISGARLRQSAVKERVNMSPQEVGFKTPRRLDFGNSPKTPNKI